MSRPTPKKRNRIIPFWLMPGSWGLEGASREEAQINYYYEGEHRARKLAEFRLAGDELEAELLAIDYAHGHITQHQLEYALIDLQDLTEVDREVAKAEADHRHSKISDNDFEKITATARGEPWIGIVNQGFDPDRGLGGIYFEFDWNEEWITFLRLNGYFGATDQDVVNQWFVDVCRSQGLEAQSHNVVPFGV